MQKRKPSFSLIITTLIMASAMSSAPSMAGEHHADQYPSFEACMEGYKQIVVKAKMRGREADAEVDTLANSSQFINKKARDLYRESSLLFDEASELLSECGRAFKKDRRLTAARELLRMLSSRGDHLSDLAESMSLSGDEDDAPTSKAEKFLSLVEEAKSRLEDGELLISMYKDQVAGRPVDAYAYAQLLTMFNTGDGTQAGRISKERIDAAIEEVTTQVVSGIEDINSEMAEFDRQMLDGMQNGAETGQSSGTPDPATSGAGDAAGKASLERRVEGSQWTLAFGDKAPSPYYGANGEIMLTYHYELAFEPGNRLNIHQFYTQELLWGDWGDTGGLPVEPVIEIGRQTVPWAVIGGNTIRWIEEYTLTEVKFEGGGGYAFRRARLDYVGATLEDVLRAPSSFDPSFRNFKDQSSWEKFSLEIPEAVLRSSGGKSATKKPSLAGEGVPAGPPVSQVEYPRAREEFSNAYVGRDYALALRLVQPWADAGYPEALSTLGMLYMEGAAVPQNTGEYLRLTRLAAEQGDVSAQFGLGMNDSDPVQQAKWLILCIRNDSSDVFDAFEGTLEDRLAAMTPEQVAEAEKLAAEWRPKTWDEIKAR